MSQKAPSRKSVYFLVKDEYFEEFETQKLGQQLAHALSSKLGVPEENVGSYPAKKDLSLKFNENTSTIIHVAKKALITILVQGVEKEEIKKHVNFIINVLSVTTGVKESEVEIVQVLPSSSCLLVIRLPGLAMVRLLVAFLSPQSQSTFLHKLAEVLPTSAFRVRFGFASLPYFSAGLPSVRSTTVPEKNTQQSVEHQPTGNLIYVYCKLPFLTS